MDDTSSLEEDFEQDLLLLELEEPPPPSTPRQRLEDARAMADGNCDVSPGGRLQGDEGGFAVPESVDGGGGEEPGDRSTHLLQRLSCAMGDSGEWKCFHDITHESQRALAEMNETLGSLRQWRKQRKVDSSSSSALASHEDAQTTAIGEHLPPGEKPLNPHECSSEPMPKLRRHKQSSDADNADGCEQENIDNQLKEDALGDGEREDRLLVLWQEHHLRAQQAVGRLQEQLDRHPPALSLTTGADTESGKVDNTTAVPAQISELTIHYPLAGEGAAESSPSGNDGVADNMDRVAELSRKVDGLQIHHWIQATRKQACDRAETLAREACEDIRQGAGSAAVGEMEGELDGFAQELDSLLLKIDRVDNDDRQEGANEGNDVLPLEVPRVPQGGLAPAADAHVDRASLE